MKAAAILVDTARGALVNEDFLFEALKNGHLAAAGLDVFATESHGLTQETLERSPVIARDNVARLENGLPLLHRVA